MFAVRYFILQKNLNNLFLRGDLSSNILPNDYFKDFKVPIKKIIKNQKQKIMMARGDPF